MAEVGSVSSREKKGEGASLTEGYTHRVGTVLEQTDRDTNDWDYFPKDIAAFSPPSFIRSTSSLLFFVRFFHPAEAAVFFSFPLALRLSRASESQLLA